MCGPGIPGPLFYLRGAMKICPPLAANLEFHFWGRRIPSASVELIGILRPLICFRFAKACASLKMTNWEKDRLGLQIAVQLFGKLFHLLQFFVEVFGQQALAQLLQIGV